MKSEIAENQKSCPREEIAFYVDGEISPREELELEMHLAVCPICSDELNAQKKLFCALDSVLAGEREIEVPENFTKIVVTRAESSVSGLRQRHERRNALFICAGLFLFVLVGSGREAETVFTALGRFAEQFAAVVGFIAHLAYDIAVGISVVLRTLSNQFVFNSAVSIVLITGLFLISLLMVSRLIVRFNRT